MTDTPDKDVKIDLAEIKKDIEYMKEKLGSIDENLKDQYVTMAEFQPVKTIAYGLVSIILLAVIGAIIKLVIIK